MKTKWIIGVHNSCADVIEFYTAEGNKRDIKREMIEIIRHSRWLAGVEDYDHGTQYMTEIKDNHDGSLYGYADLNYYHVDVSAKKIKDMKNWEVNYG